MREFLSHLFLPRESNNQRAKILHNQSFLVTILFVSIFGFFIAKTSQHFSEVLGITANIASEELLSLTNQVRQKEGAGQLTINPQLVEAANLKAKDMFSKNYWAHNAPDGTTPWVFVKKSGYTYMYAGENLARGFTTSTEVVDAWMASPTHRSNMLSSNYSDIGFAVVEGKLTGEDTVLVVEMFGSQTIHKQIAQNSRSIKSTEISEQTPNQNNKTFAATIVKNPFINSFALGSESGIIILSIFISILILDMIIIERKKIVRLVGHNVDHILFLSGILILIILFGKGIVL